MVSARRLAKPVSVPVIDDIVTIAVLVGQPIAPVPIPMGDRAAVAVIGLLATVPTLTVLPAMHTFLISAISLITRMAMILSRASSILVPLLLVPLLSKGSNRWGGQNHGDDQRYDIVFHLFHPKRLLGTLSNRLATAVVQW
jgi:hypothetical protein